MGSLGHHRKRSLSGIRPREEERGRRHYVVIEGEMKINTTALDPATSSQMKFEFYEGEWHMSHNYRSGLGYGTSYGAFGGAGSTQRCIEYLEQQRARIRKKRAGLEGIDRQLGMMQRRLEADAEANSRSQRQAKSA